MKKEQAKQLIEDFVRKEVRKSLNEGKSFGQFQYELNQLIQDAVAEYDSPLVVEELKK